MSNLMKRFILGIVALLVVFGIGYGVYSYKNSAWPFTPTETEAIEEVVEEVEEVSITE